MPLYSLPGICQGFPSDSGVSGLPRRSLAANRVTFLDAPEGAAGKLWSQSQMHRSRVSRLLSMGVKYYTHFVLTGEAAEGNSQEFSGVVEVNQVTERRFETQEIEALLARNFDLDSAEEVRLINWSRLQ